MVWFFYVYLIALTLNMNKIIIIIFLSVCSQLVYGQLFLDLEGNLIASVPYNEVKVPSSTGTQVDLANDLSLQSSFTGRLRVNYIFREKHLVSFLFAPLVMRSTGMIDETIVYNEQSFKPNDPLEALYKFNSYRFTYRYLFIRNEDVILGLGLSANIRDARITMQTGNKSSEFDNVGVVPLLNFYGLWSPFNNWMTLVEGDAMVSGNGRAEDVFAGIGYRFSDMFVLKGGYRLQEGGSNNEKIYNFACVNYAALGILVSF